MSATDFPPGGPEAKSSLSSTLRILLIVSLALNTFFLGAGAVMLGRMMTGGGPHRTAAGAHMRGEFPGPGRMLRTLSPETRARIEKETGPDQAAMRAAITAAQQARREAFQALSAEPFSADVLRQKLTAAEVADVEAIRAVHRMMMGVTAQLTPEERAKIIAELKTLRPPPGFGAGADGPPRPDGPPPSGP